MALIKCRECGKEISDTADRCIHCGCPLRNENTHVSVSNFYIWLLAFLPLLATILLICIWIIFDSYIIGILSTIVFITILTLIFIKCDYSLLKKSGINLSTFGKFSLFKVITPTYIYKRAALLKQSLSYFVVWLVCTIFFALLILSIFIRAILLNVAFNNLQNFVLDDCGNYTLQQQLESYIDNATWDTKLNFPNEDLITLSGQMYYYGESKDVTIIYVANGIDFTFKDIIIGGKSEGVDVYNELIDYLC